MRLKRKKYANILFLWYCNYSYNLMVQYRRFTTQKPAPAADVCRSSVTHARKKVPSPS